MFRRRSIITVVDMAGSVCTVYSCGIFPRFPSPFLNDEHEVYGATCMPPKHYEELQEPFVTNGALVTPFRTVLPRWRLVRASSLADLLIGYFLGTSKVALLLLATTDHVANTNRVETQNRAVQSVLYRAILVGAPRGIRTPNLLIRSQMLYPLS